MPAEVTAGLQEAEVKFLAMHDEIRSRAWTAFRYANASDREEAQAETVAWAWSWCLSAAKRGRLNRLTPFSIVSYAALLIRSGRQFAGDAKRDVLSPQAKAAGQVRVRSLQDLPAIMADETRRRGTIAKGLTDSRRAGPPEVARVNHDYALLGKDAELSQRAVEVFMHLVADNGKGHVRRIAEQLAVSSPRICQLKARLREGLTRLGYGPRVRAVSAA